MTVLKLVGRQRSRDGLPRYWRDAHGEIRLMGIIDGYAMMRRPGKIPFVVRSKDLLSGAAGIERDDKLD